jgi:hypothetical protein
MRVVLDAAAALVQRVTGEAGDVERGYSQLGVVLCSVKVFMPRVGRRCGAGYGLGSGLSFGSRGRSV